MNELATKAANDTLETTDRTYIQSELNALSTEIDRTSAATEFNNQKLLDGDFTEKKLQVGSETDDENQIEISISQMSASMIGVQASNIDVSSHSDAKVAMSNIKDALQSVSKQRSDLGAIQNRLEHTIKNLDNVVENTQSAESLIRDTDMATEMVKYSNNNILAQAGQSMLAQANQTNQGVLSLLG
jgi:flagellin